LPLDIEFVLLGIAIRQVDRWWFSDSRSGLVHLSRRFRADTIRALMAKQRQRRNNWTPTIVMAGHWIEIVGYWLLCARPGVVATALGCVALAVKARHLQEISHFGVHASLCRGRRLGDLLTELTAHGPLALSTVDGRWETHVRQHHPNATVPGLDPNLADLARAGLGPGCGRWRFVRAMVFPLTPGGLVSSCRSMLANTFAGRDRWWRPGLMAGLAAAAYACGGVRALLALAVARVALYPLLAWASVLVEHSWFRGRPRSGRPLEVESRRCVRVYPGRQALTLLARTTWLPYGDIFHFAHSVYPTVRWNYLPAVERLIGMPHLAPGSVVLGRQSVVALLYRAVGPGVPSRAAGPEHDPGADPATVPLHLSRAR
jgi:fatty acid desaturase